MVANRSSNSHSLASECIKSNDGDEEIIKVRSLALLQSDLVEELGLEKRFCLKLHQQKSPQCSS